MEDYLENVLENTINGQEVAGDASERKEKRQTMGLCPGKSKEKSHRFFGFPGRRKALEDVLQEFFA